MEEITPKVTVGDVFKYLLAYILWLLNAAIGLVGILLLRNAWNWLWTAISGNQWALRAIDRFGLVTMDLLWLIYVIFTEQHFRLAITSARIRRMKERREAPIRQASLPQGRFAKFLRRTGLDILASRFLPNLMMPMSLVMISYLMDELANELLTR